MSRNDACAACGMHRDFHGSGPANILVNHAFVEPAPLPSSGDDADSAVDISDYVPPFVQDENDARAEGVPCTDDEPCAGCCAGSGCEQDLWDKACAAGRAAGRAAAFKECEEIASKHANDHEATVRYYDAAASMADRIADAIAARAGGMTHGR